MASQMGVSRHHPSARIGSDAAAATGAVATTPRSVLLITLGSVGSRTARKNPHGVAIVGAEAVSGVDGGDIDVADPAFAAIFQAKLQPLPIRAEAIGGGISRRLRFIQ